MTITAFMQQTGAPLTLSPVGEAAVELAGRGLRVFPCHSIRDGRCTCKEANCSSPGKHPWQKKLEPSNDAEKVRDMFLLRRHGNVGIATGDGLLVLDIDGPLGEESLGELERSYEELPPTLTARTGRDGGRHVYLSTDADIHNSAGRLGKGLDVRGQGGYVIAPPSVHLSGRTYQWEDPNATIAEAPAWLVAVILAAGTSEPEPKPEPTPAPRKAPSREASSSRREAYVRAAINAEIGKVLSAPEGVRNDELNKAAFALGQLVGGGELLEGDVERELMEAAGAWIGQDCIESEIRKTIRSGLKGGKREPRHVPEPDRPTRPTPGDATHLVDDGIRDNPRLTELGNAERFVKQHGASVLFCNTWHAWDGSRWRPDDRGDVDRMAQATARSWWREAESAPPDMQLTLAKHAKKMESSSAITATLKLARPMRCARPTDLDADPMKLNTSTGIIDLATGKQHPHDRAAMMTKLAPVAYAGLDTPAPLWERFLHRIMAGNTTMTSYLQRLSGMCLTGDISVQELWILWGQGSNGKSVFMDSLMALMGDYAGSAPNSLLTHRGGFSEHPTELYDLKGRRLVVGSETEEGAELKVQLMKQLTGNATIKARAMRCDYVEFARTHKLVLPTNNRPLVKETSHAVWRRLRLVPFTVTIPPEERDGHLIDKLQDEWPGILAWAVRGCLDWQRHGLDTPSEVMLATGEYQAEQDALSEYLADRCVRGPGARVQRNDLHTDYLAYCVSQGDKHPMARNTFFDRIRRVAGVGEVQTRICGVPARVFTGISLAGATAQQGATGV